MKKLILILSSVFILGACSNSTTIIYRAKTGCVIYSMFDNGRNGADNLRYDYRLDCGGGNNFITINSDKRFNVGDIISLDIMPTPNSTQSESASSTQKGN